jgi:alanine dehydrogenase
MVDITFVTAAELQAVGAELTTEDIHDAVDNAWREIRSGQAIGGKAVLSLREDDFWKTEQFAPFRESFSDERLGWKLSSLYSVNSRYAGVKIIGANAFNRRLGLPRSTSTFLLLEKFTLRPIVILDGTVLSAVRTGTYASVVAQRCIRSKTGTSVFIFGAGPVARSVVQSLDYALGDKITRFFVRSRTIESARSLTLSLAEETTIPLEPVCDNRSLRECAFVVTASNARYPLFSDEELCPEATTLHLGGDEVPEAYLQRVLRTGLVACDDLQTVSRRNSQSLALHFSRKGLSLEAIGRLIGIKELSSEEDWYEENARPVCVTCVGLPMLDLFVAQAAIDKYARAMGMAAGRFECAT